MSDTTPSAVPVVILASTDAVERDAAILSMLLEVPGLVVVAHDLSEESGEPTLRREVSDAGGVRHRADVHLDHPCLGCMIREDAAPAIAALLAEDLPGVLLALPLGAQIFPAAHSLLGHMDDTGILYGFRLGATTAVTSSSGALRQLDDADEDLVTHLVEADLVVVSDGDESEADPLGADLVDALRGPASRRVDDLCGTWATEALSMRHDPEALARRADPASAEAGHGFARHGVRPDGLEVSPSGAWRLVLRSDRPLHPDRLMASIRLLGAEHTISHGRFRVANRPDALCDWQAVGGSVRIGTVGPVSGAADTRIVVVGHGEGHRGLQRAFEHSLTTEAELRAGIGSWLGRPDPLLPYLGEPSEIHRGTGAPGIA